MTYFILPKCSKEGEKWKGALLVQGEQGPLAITPDRAYCACEDYKPLRGVIGIERELAKIHKALKAIRRKLEELNQE